MTRMKRFTVMAMVMVLLAGICGAQEFAGLLRDELALGLTPTTANWGMGGAYVGVPGAASMNPAALGFVEGSSVSMSGLYWNPGTGADVYGGRTDVIFPFIFNSHARLMAHYYETRGTGPVNLGPPPPLPGGGQFSETEFRSMTLGLQLGIPITDNLAIGFGGYPYEKAEIDLYDPVTAGGVLVEGEAFSQLGSFQAGLQWKILDNLTVGAEYIYIIDEMQGDISVGGPVAMQLSDDFYITYGAFGISWAPFEKTLLAVDYRMGEIEGEAAPPNVNFDLDVDRWAGGIQQGVTDWLTLRVGYNNAGITMGFSIMIGETATIDYTFVDDAYCDREEFFDNIELHSFAVSIQF